MIFVPLLVVGAGILLLPSLFYDGFLWKYFLGPVVADAKNEPVGSITEGYNLVNTTCYAVIMVVALLGVYELFRRRIVEFRMNFRMVIALVPYLILGGTLRASEDLGLFTEPAAYLFIAPFLYATIATLVLAAVLVAIYANYFALKSYKSGFFFLIRAVISMNAAYLLAYALFPGAVLFYPHPALFAVLSFAMVLGIYVLSREKKTIGIAQVFGGIGIVLLSMSVITLANWGGVPAWTEHYLDLTERTSIPQTHPEDILAVIGLALICTFLVCLLFYAASKRYRKLVAFATPLTALMVFAQFFDGSATFIGINFYGYGEKHVLPTNLISLTGSAVIMFPMKLALIIAVVYIVDILYKKELGRYENIPVLAKTLVIVLGLAPGVRDAVRVAMGV